MIKYKEYKKACDLILKWKIQKKDIQIQRKKLRSIEWYLGDNDLSLSDKLKLSIVSLGYTQAKKHLELKHIESDEKLYWAIDIVKKEINVIQAARNEYRRMINNINIKNSQ